MGKMRNACNIFVGKPEGKVKLDGGGKILGK
jgi:hypothetical protein